MKCAEFDLILLEENSLFIHYVQTIMFYYEHCCVSACVRGEVITNGMFHPVKMTAIPWGIALSEDRRTEDPAN